MEARNLLLRKPSAKAPGVELEILPEGRKAIAAARPVHARAIKTRILKFVSAEHSDALIALAQHLVDEQ
jgi:DNA-binding MarR family transcriptional regulator